MNDSRIFRVTGAPGTGKTTYLAHQCERAADRHGAGTVAIASLTKTAAATIADKVSDAGTPIPVEQIGTLHAHAYRTLECEPGQMAETPGSLREFDAAHPGALGDMPHAGDALEDAPTPSQDSVHSAVQNHRARIKGVETWTPAEKAHLCVWNDFKRQTGRLDFTDLIERCLNADAPTHFAAPKIWLLDEAQDFSALEMALVARWARDADTAVIVGDDLQRLYAWRGSDDGMAAIDATSDRLLAQSRRVPAAVHAAAQAWVAQHPGGAQPWKPTAEPGSVELAPHGLRDTHVIVDAVRADLAAGRTSMVLCACRHQLSGVLGALRDAGIPFHNPHRVKEGAWNPMRSAGPLTAFLRPDPQTWGEQARTGWWTWEDLRRWTDPLQASRALARGAKAAIEQHCRPGRFGEDRSGEAVPDDVLATLLAESLPRAVALDVDWWQSCLRAKHAKAQRYPLAVLKAQGGRALTETPMVTVGTFHSVKGGEASSVHICPDLSRAGYWGPNGWHDGGAGRDGIVRMFYVALTRARERVCVMQPSVPEHVDPRDLVAGALDSRCPA